ncbi:cell division protein FtsI [Nocardiopsis sp. TSRI0078]|uniref:penicillin-binding transpeptidase domain-containing protein n=1 Tax=unclassified Nocardiopsis TaxID=2649073 RepID=UPI00093DDC8B|nr:penicillin-binding transpeptidase domain-containing protein [Nocardiopsis sp. TSRI0078]OKI15119.1 cell division protein FtsI [Nocardiopsis sp. TSRI0078]
MSPRPLGRLTAAGSGLLLAATLAACTPHPSPEVAVRSFLLAWQDGNHAEAATYTDGDPEQVAAALTDMREQLDLASLRFDLGPISREGESADAEFGVHADLGIGDPTWNYTGRMPLEWGPDGWRISWSTSVLHPDLSEDERLAISYESQERGQILDREGEPLVTADSVTAFGVLPGEMEDKEAGVTQLAELLDEDPDPLLNRVRSAPPEQFQPLVLLRGSSVDGKLLSEAGGISGVDTREVEVNMTPSVAPFLLGEVAGTAEHRVSSRVPGPYRAGDTVGLSGLQNIFQHELAGSGTTQVVSLDRAGGITDVLEAWEGERSGVIGTTLDIEVQRAAENALQALPGDGYLVAVDTASGEILSAASASGNTADDNAFTGSYVPGGAFTPVSTLAALESGAAGPDDVVPCGYSTEIGGRTFVNPSSGFLSGQPDLARNLAFSCNVGFADLSADVGRDAVAAAAEHLGIGAEWQLPVPASSGTVSIGGEDVDVASAMIGEHGVRVSPLSMALATAAIADGTWHAPTLVPEEGPAPDSETTLDETRLEVVREGMRDAVANRMPQLLATGGEVYGQAARTEQDGTALHWFVGYKDGVAFAVLAEVDPEMTQWSQYAVDAAGTFLASMANGVPAGESGPTPEESAAPPNEADLTGGEGIGGTDAQGTGW